MMNVQEVIAAIPRLTLKEKRVILEIIKHSIKEEQQIEPGKGLAADQL